MKKSVIPVLSLIIAVAGCILVNIKTTKSLSPLGNTVKNYDLVTEEFGKEFSEFIKDKAPVKIYVNNKENAAEVLIGGKSINLTKDNPIIKKVSPIFDFLGKKVNNIVDNISEKTENNNDDNEKIDDVVDSFIEWYEKDN